LTASGRWVKRAFAGEIPNGFHAGPGVLYRQGCADRVCATEFLQPNFVQKRFALALAAYVALAALALTTLSDRRIRMATLAVLALFALKTWVRRNDVIHPDGESGAE